MSQYLVEVYVPRDLALEGGPREAAVRAAAEELTLAGTPVRLTTAVALPDEELCLYVLEAASGDVAKWAVTRTGLRCERVTSALTEPGPSIGGSSLDPTCSTGRGDAPAGRYQGESDAT